MPRYCYICNQETHSWRQNLTEWELKNSNISICDLLKTLLKDDISHRNVEDEANCVCDECYERIEEYDAMKAKVLVAENELRAKIISTEQFFMRIKLENERDEVNTEPSPFEVIDVSGIKQESICDDDNIKSEPLGLGKDQCEPENTSVDTVLESVTPHNDQTVEGACATNLPDDGSENLIEVINTFGHQDENEAESKIDVCHDETIFVKDPEETINDMIGLAQHQLDSISTQRRTRRPVIIRRLQTNEMKNQNLLAKPKQMMLKGRDGRILKLQLKNSTQTNAQQATPLQRPTNVNQLQRKQIFIRKPDGTLVKVNVVTSAVKRTETTTTTTTQSQSEQSTIDKCITKTSPIKITPCGPQFRRPIPPTSIQSRLSSLRANSLNSKGNRTPKATSSNASTVTPSPFKPRISLRECPKCKDGTLRNVKEYEVILSVFQVLKFDQANNCLLLFFHSVI